MVKVRILRPWGTSERTYRPGQILEVPAAQADRMAKTSPPFAERVRAEAKESARAEPKKADGEG